MSDPHLDQSYARTQLILLLNRLHEYDISTFKIKLEEISSKTDLREDGDKTDFTFKQRRSNDQ